jgi:hypothetical protein
MNIPLRKEGHYNAYSLQIRGVSRLLIAIRPLPLLRSSCMNPYPLMASWPSFLWAGKGAGGCPHCRASPYTLQLLGKGKKKHNAYPRNQMLFSKEQKVIMSLISNTKKQKKRHPTLGEHTCVWLLIWLWPKLLPPQGFCQKLGSHLWQFGVSLCQLARPSIWWKSLSIKLQKADIHLKNKKAHEKHVFVFSIMHLPSQSERKKTKQEVNPRNGHRLSFFPT